MVEMVMKPQLLNRNLQILLMEASKQAPMEASKQAPMEMVKKPPLFPPRRKWTSLDRDIATSLLVLHLLCVFAPFYFTWGGLWIAITLGNLTGMAISVSYHRNLAHRSFKLPRWLEYLLAYCASHAFQGDPLDWVSTHRCHHRYVDTERDPHSPIQGFWFSQFTWLFDSYTLTKKVAPNYFKDFKKVDRNIFMLFLKHGIPDNVTDLERQPFYRFMHKTYFLHPIILAAVLYAFGGVSYVVWGMCVRIVGSLHITSMVNSVCHIWGRRQWNTDDLSRNNWIVALLTWGEGWHNNHHAFEYSARHGLEWWQLDWGWYIIRFLQALGLATDVKLPSERLKQKMAALDNPKLNVSKPYY